MRHDNSHFGFLAAILAGSEPHARALGQSPGWNGEEIIRIASDETVLPSLYGPLLRLGLVESVPAGVSDFLQAYRDLNRGRNTQILHELEEIGVALNGIGIEPVLLKGLAYLLTDIYPDRADRFLLDIDLLTAPAEAEAAFRQLLASGYQTETDRPTVLARDYHLPPLVHPSKVRVELHQELGLGSIPGLLPEACVRSESTPVTLGRARVRIPRPEHLLIHLVAHSQLHHGYDQRIWPPLRSLYDLHLLHRHFGDALNWPEVFRCFRRAGCLGILQTHLLQVRQVLGSDLPIGPLSLWTRLRWLRRRALWAAPWLRWVDPRFLYKALLGPRLPLAPKLLRLSAGRQFLLRHLFRWRTYRRIFASLDK